MKKFLIGTSLSLAIAAIGGLIYFQNQNAQPPTLTPETSIFQGFLKSDKNSQYKGFLKFEDSDKPKFEKLKEEKMKAGKELRIFDVTKENMGVHYIYFNESKTAKEVIEQMDPSAKAIAIAVFNASINKWDITEQDFYVAEFTNIKNPEDLTIPAGKSAVIVTAGNTSIFDAKDGQHKATYEFKPCDQTAAGWYNYAMTESKGLNLGECLNSVKDVFVQTDHNPMKFEKISNIADYKTEKYSLVWVNFKEKPAKTSTTEKPFMSEVKVQSKSQTSVSLTWPKPSGVENYSIEYKKSSEDDSKYYLDKTFSSSNDPLVIEISGLSPKTEYDFRIKAIVGENSSDPTYVKATTLGYVDGGGTPAQNDAPTKPIVKYPKNKDKITLSGTNQFNWTTSDSNIHQTKIVAGANVETLTYIWKFKDLTTNKDGWSLPMEWNGTGVTSYESMDKVCFVDVFAKGVSTKNATSPDWICNYMAPHPQNFQTSHEYEFQVQAYDGKVYSEWSDVVKFTIEDAAPVADLKPPTTAFATQGEGKITLTWSPPAGSTPTKYVVDIFKDGNKLSGHYDNYTTEQIFGSSYKYLGITMNGGEKYVFEVKAIYEEESSAAVKSNEITITAPVVAAANVAPEAPVIKKPSSNQVLTLDPNKLITFEWSTPKDDQIIQKIGTANGKDILWHSYEWEFIDTSNNSSVWALNLAWNGTVFDENQDKNCNYPMYDLAGTALSSGKDWACSLFVMPQNRFQPGKKYKFKVRAYDGGEFSEWAEVEFTTAAEATKDAPETVTDLGGNYTGDYIQLLFEPVSGIDSYEIYYKNNTTDFTLLSTTANGNNAYSTTPEITATGLGVAKVYNLSAGNYQFAIKTIKEGMKSNFSAESKDITVALDKVIGVTATYDKAKETASVSWTSVKNAKGYKILFYHGLDNAKNFLLEEYNSQNIDYIAPYFKVINDTQIEVYDLNTLEVGAVGFKIVAINGVVESPPSQHKILYWSTPD